MLTKTKNTAMVISREAKKLFEQAQHSFMIKMLNKIGMKGTELKKMEVRYVKPTVNIIISRGNRKFSL